MKTPRTFEEEKIEQELHDPSDRYGQYEGLEEVQDAYGELDNDDMDKYNSDDIPSEFFTER